MWRNNQTEKSRDDPGRVIRLFIFCSYSAEKPFIASTTAAQSLGRSNIDSTRAYSRSVCSTRRGRRSCTGSARPFRRCSRHPSRRPAPLHPLRPAVFLADAVHEPAQPLALFGDLQAAPGCTESVLAVGALYGALAKQLCKALLDPLHLCQGGEPSAEVQLTAVRDGIHHSAAPDNRRVHVGALFQVVERLDADHLVGCLQDGVASG